MFKIFNALRKYIKDKKNAKLKKEIIILVENVIVLGVRLVLGLTCFHMKIINLFLLVL